MPGDALGLRQLGVVVVDARVDVQGHIDPVGAGPTEERDGVGEERAVPFPAVPVVGRLPVGVEREGVEGYVVGDELRIERVLDGAARIGRVVRVPDAEDVPGQEGGRAGQLGQGVQGPGVVVAVDKEVTVLEVAVCAGGARPSRCWSTRRSGVSSSKRQPAVSSNPSVLSGSMPAWHVSPDCPGPHVG